jgi:hypothetical protein
VAGVAGISSTRPDDVPIEVQRRHRAWRRGGLAALAAFVLAGAANLLGLRVGSVTAHEGAMSLEVTYARVTRPGLATPWELSITRPGGFDGPVTVATTASYFEAFDFNQWYPEPSGTVARGDVLLLTFDRPLGDVFIVRFDGRATPTFNLGSHAVTSIETEGLPQLAVEYRTVVVP